MKSVQGQLDMFFVVRETYTCNIVYFEMMWIYFSVKPPEASSMEESSRKKT